MAWLRMVWECLRRPKQTLEGQDRATYMDDPLAFEREAEKLKSQRGG